MVQPKDLVWGAVDLTECIVSLRAQGDNARKQRDNKGESHYSDNA